MPAGDRVIVYLAAPIDMANDEVRMARHWAKMALQRVGYTVFDPASAWIGPIDERQQGVNLEAIHRCDGLFAVMLPNVMSVGVPLEIHEAVRLQIPVAVWTPRESMVLAHLGVTQHENLNACVAALNEMMVDDAATDNVGRRREIRFAGEGTLPAAVYSDDAGYDLFVSRRTRIASDQTIDVPHAISVELPVGVWALLLGRSSTLHKRGLIVAPAVIDTGYRGHLYAVCHNVSRYSVIVEEGERIAQVILLPNLTSQYEPQMAAELTPSNRGAKGFGSSGQ